MSLISQLESLLFVSVRPLSLKKLAALLSVDEKEVNDAILSLSTFYDESRGLRLVVNDGSVQFTTSPDNGELIADFLKEELSGELRGAALETLSVIAYRAPISKVEIEHIRGVNCAQSLKNLLLRGLIEERKGEHTGERVYVPAMRFLNHLGVQSVGELPHYDKLHSADITTPLESISE